MLDVGVHPCALHLVDLLGFDPEEQRRDDLSSRSMLALIDLPAIEEANWRKLGAPKMGGI